MPLRALFHSRPALPRSIELIHGQTVFQIRLRRHRAARRYTISIQPATREAVLTMPQRGTLKAARAFAQEQAGWIAARLDKVPQAIAFADGSLIPLRDRLHRIDHRPGQRGTVWSETDADGEAVLCVAGDRPHIHRRVEDFLKREARRDIAAALKLHGEALGVRPRRMSLRDPSSRWGSCSSSGTLSFSWRLILAPEFVLDYLVAHEVAHLLEMNHSPRFWALVGSRCPQIDRAKAWLDHYGNDLHRYGALTDRAD